MAANDMDRGQLLAHARAKMGLQGADDILEIRCPSCPFVAVNHGPNPVLIGLDATEKTRGFVSSRGTSLLSQDVIPPRSRCWSTCRRDSCSHRASTARQPPARPARPAPAPHPSCRRRA